MKSRVSTRKQLLLRKNRLARREGALLLEAMIAMTLLTVGVLGFLVATQANFRATRDISTQDLVNAALQNALERIKEDAFANLYINHNNTSINPPTGMTSGSGTTPVGELVDGDGNPAQVFVSFDVDETNLPAGYGPVVDLDGDGALATTNVSGDYDLLPTRLSLTYQTATGLQTRQLFVLLGNDG